MKNHQKNVANSRRSKFEIKTKKNDQIVRNIVNCDAKSNDWNLNMFRDFYHNHKMQRAKKTIWKKNH